MKYCKDCKHLHEGSIAKWCESPRREIDKVTGDHELMFAWSARNWEGHCGQHAAWFEPKPPKPVSFWKRLFGVNHGN